MNDQAKEMNHKLEWHSKHRYADQLVSNDKGELIGAIYMYHPYDPRIEDVEKMLKKINEVKGQPE